MADSDLITLYSTRILALAADIPHHARLESPQATVRKRAPLCGSTVTIDMDVSDGKVSAYGQDIKACALGQAAASVVSSVIIGQDRAAILLARDQLRDMLNGSETTPAAPFEDLKVLAPARDYKNRHGSIMLALDTALEAFDAAAQGHMA